MGTPSRSCDSSHLASTPSSTPTRRSSGSPGSERLLRQLDVGKLLHVGGAPQSIAQRCRETCCQLLLPALPRPRQCVPRRQSLLACSPAHELQGLYRATRAQGCVRGAYLSGIWWKHVMYCAEPARKLRFDGPCPSQAT